jgi:hypothetical protein
MPREGKLTGCHFGQGLILKIYLKVRVASTISFMKSITTLLPSSID